MLNKKSISALILTTFIIFSPKIALAAEESISSLLPPIWPFLAFVLLVIVFRKQLNCVPPSKPQEDQVTQVNPEPTSTVETENVVADTDITDNIIDLKDNSRQCQASTAKGTRCKRKTTLEDTSISIDNKTYLLTVCRQHNNDHLKPFSGLIK